MQVSDNDKRLIEEKITPILEGMKKNGATDREIQAFTIKYIRNWKMGVKKNGLQPLGEIMPDTLRGLRQR